MMKINLYSKALRFSGLAKDKRFTTFVQFVDFVETEARPGHVFRGAQIHNKLMDIDISSISPKAILVRGAYGPFEARFPAVQIMVLQESGYLSRTKIFTDISSTEWEQDIGKHVLDLLFRLSKEKKEKQAGTVELSAGKEITLLCGEKLAQLAVLFPGKSPTEIVEFALDYLERSLASKQ